MERLGLKACKVYQGHLGPQEIKDLLVSQDLMEILECLAILDQEVILERMERMDHQVRQAQQDPLEKGGLLEHLEQEASKACLGHLANQDSLVRMDKPVFLVNLA